MLNSDSTLCICISDGMERHITGFAYIQGSGDDHELWSMTLRANCNELPTLVQALTSFPNTLSTRTDSNSYTSFRPIPIQHVHGRLSICTTHDISSPGWS
ncbi:uncharacterized protein HD556DRAFT_434049 [Suillus plorans]|uniref:Rit1 N-terminal domain-containing protein n=1 Tax=Suillus plorans TaxID=116603 RepID=A0A9P7DIQ2_9AGAM|nr:uncharacterized protein HD556DRAFT_434049 [Suillus plorans]KAG1794433.1 hypothetical protein HD556DRAFT_434049 [Suillus plorans]